jgi:hypothetical protein
MALLVIAGLWLTGHPAIIDRGPPPGETYPKWDDHSWGHLGGSAALALLFCWLTDLPFVAFLLSAMLWAYVELAQQHPRDNQGGHFDWWDLLWDVLGAGGMAAICALFDHG